MFATAVAKFLLLMLVSREVNRTQCTADVSVSYIRNTQKKKSCVKKKKTCSILVVCRSNTTAIPTSNAGYLALLLCAAVPLLCTLFIADTNRATGI